MNSFLDQQEGPSRAQWRLHDIVYAIVVLAIICAIVTPAARSGATRDWDLAAAAFGIAGFLLSPVVLICLVTRFAPTSLDAERGAAELVLKSILVVILLAMATLIHAN